MSVNDTKYRILSSELEEDGSISELEWKWLANLVSPYVGSIPDMWREYLRILGYSDQASFLRDMGYPGTVTEQWNQYWEDLGELSNWEAFPAMPSTFTYNGFTYQSHSANRDYSTMKHKTNSNLLRFELRKGDEWANDAGRTPPYERAEINRVSGDWAEQEVWASFSLKPKGVTGPGLKIMFQFINSAGPEIMLISTPTSTILRTYTTSSTFVNRYTGPAMSDDTPEDWVIRYVPNASAAELQVWRNGVEVLNGTGYTIHMNTSRRHKTGIYRPATNQAGDEFYTTRVVTEVANLTVSNSSLSAKVGTPDPWPDTWA